MRIERHGKHWEWETIGCIPAIDGYRALYFERDDPSKPIVSPVVAWLIQEQRCYSSFDEPIEEIHYARRVVAGDLDNCEITPVSEADNFWCILTPSENIPSEDACLKSWADHCEQKRRLEELKKKRSNAVQPSEP